VAKIVDDLDVLTAFYDYPAEHWIHLRTANPRPRESNGRAAQRRRPRRATRPRFLWLRRERDDGLRGMVFVGAGSRWLAVTRRRLAATQQGTRL
jgi:hypothetical protein